MTLRAGMRLRKGRYLLVGPLGRGGFATVWRAVDTAVRKGDAREVALKLLPAEDGGAEAAAREAEVMARVKHPNVVRVRDTFVDEGWAGIVMELGLGSLADLVTEEGPLAPDVALAAVLQACAGLGAAHAVGVVHRDVKPHNLILFPDGTVKLGDFGVARAHAEGHTRTRTAQVLGSVPFMAPEQRRDPRAVRPATDVYGMSVTLAWLMLGEAPGDLFAAGMLGELVERGVPVALAEALVRAGAHDAGARPQTGTELGEGLGACGVEARREGLCRSIAGGEDVRGGRDLRVAEEGASVVRVPRWPYAPQGWVVVGALVLAALAMAISGWSAARPGTGVEPATSYPRCDGFVRDWVQDIRRGPREAVDATIRDLDLDGFPDVVFVNQGEPSLTVYWGRAGGMPSLSTEIPTVRADTAPGLGDFDGDGVLDLLVASPDFGVLQWLRQGPARSFVESARWQETPNPRWPWLHDIDGDGKVDAVFQGGPQLFWRRNVGGDLQPHLALRKLEGTPTLRGRGASLEVMDVSPVGAAHTRLRGGTRQDWEAVRSMPDMGPPLRRAVRTSEGFALAAAGMQPLQVVEQGKPCALGEATSTLPHAFADLDGDSILDAVTTRTCAGCESNHVFLRGL